MATIAPILTAIVLAKNEAVRIAVCLKSLSWADHVIVIDNGSTDITREIAKKYKAHVIKNTSTDFSVLRELGQKQARGAWLLYIDADEEVPKELRLEIEKTIAAFDPAVSPHGYTIKRENYYLGYSWPFADGMMRLFYAPALIGWKGSLHETAVVDGPVGTLTHSLIHRTHRTLEEMVEKTNVWSDVEAQLRLQSGHPQVVWWRLVRVMITGFWDSFVTQGGWKAGTMGWVESIYQSFSMFITYAKLWEMQQNNENNKVTK